MNQTLSFISFGLTFLSCLPWLCFGLKRVGSRRILCLLCSLRPTRCPGTVSKLLERSSWYRCSMLLWSVKALQHRLMPQSRCLCWPPRNLWTLATARSDSGRQTCNARTSLISRWAVLRPLQRQGRWKGFGLQSIFLWFAFWKGQVQFSVR